MKYLKYYAYILFLVGSAPSSSKKLKERFTVRNKLSSGLIREVTQNCTYQMWYMLVLYCCRNWFRDVFSSKNLSLDSKIIASCK